MLLDGIVVVSELLLRTQRRHFLLQAAKSAIRPLHDTLLAAELLEGGAAHTKLLCNFRERKVKVLPQLLLRYPVSTHGAHVRSNPGTQSNWKQNRTQSNVRRRQDNMQSSF